MNKTTTHNQSNRRQIVVEPVCAVCGCAEQRACEDGCFWAFEPKADEPRVCSNCVYEGTRTPLELADRFQKDHQVHWIQSVGLMGVVGPWATVIRVGARRILIQLDEEKTNHWVTPGRLMDAEPFAPPALRAAA